MSRFGFTLIELMIGVGILVIAIAGLLGVFTACFGLNESAGNLTIAISHARCVIEEVRDRNIPSIITGIDWATWAQSDPPGGGGCNNLNGESVQVSYPSGAGANPLEILVTVNWTEKGRARNAQLATLLTER